MTSNFYLSETVITAALGRLIDHHQTLQAELKTIQVDSISTAKCIEHTKRIAKSSAKIEAYNEMLDLIKDLQVAEVSA